MNFRTPVNDVSVADTLSESVDRQVWIPNYVVSGVETCDLKKMIFQVNDDEHDDVSSRGLASEVYALGRVDGVGNRNNVGGYVNDVFVSDQNHVETAQVANIVGEVEMDHNVNGNAVGESLKQGISVLPKLSSSDGDAKPLLILKSEEAIMNGLEIKAMNDSNESYMANFTRDLDPFLSTNKNQSAHMQANQVTSRPGSYVSDLVWGKIRSHPWWPGQIFHPSAASEKAKRYSMRNSYLIAYFGYGKFSWNNMSKVKHFCEYFAQMEKQSSKEDFVNAVACALEEFSKRVEFGLACSCIPKEAYAKIKKQVIVNDGIREESSTRDGGDRFLNASSFSPVKLIGNVKTLARLPYHGRVDRLQSAIVKGQLSAFYRWKGCLQLCEFSVLGELFADIPLLQKGKSGTENDAVDSSSGFGRSNYQVGSYHEQKRICRDSSRLRKTEERVSCFLSDSLTNMLKGGKELGGNGESDAVDSSSGLERSNYQVDSSSGLERSNYQEGSYYEQKPIFRDNADLRKIEERVSRFLADSLMNMLNGGKESGGKGDMLILSSTGKKRKAVESISSETIVKLKKSEAVSDASVKCKKSEFANKFANQQNGLSLMLNNSDGTSNGTAIKDKGKKLPFSHSKNSFLSKESFVDDFFSHLLAAQAPTKQISSVSLVTFFSEFRNYVIMEKRSLEDISGTEAREVTTKSEIARTSESKSMKDSYWTDRIIQSIPEAPLPLENANETPSRKNFFPSETQPAFQSSVTLEHGLQVEPAGHKDAGSSECPYLTVLTLKFRNLESVPSEETLNSVMGRFGPLYEPKTEVLKNNRAQVVFMRREDAMSACSSVRDSSCFGPSLVCYRLRFMPIPKRAFSRGRKQSRKLDAGVEGNAS